MYINAQVAQTFLRKMGVSTFKGTTASAAVRKAFSVILMDDNMPNLSRPETTAAIRAAGYDGLIFGVTGNSFAEQIKNFKNRVFTKPTISMTELCTKPYRVLTYLTQYIIYLPRVQ